VRAVAEPGSGKTLGFLLPAIPLLLGRMGADADAGSAGPIVLILVPTRCDRRLSKDNKTCILGRDVRELCEVLLRLVKCFP
jgi:hypothetical protein